MSNLSLDRFSSGERAPSIQWIGDSVGPRAGQDAVTKMKSPSPWRESSPVHPACYLHLQGYAGSLQFSVAMLTSVLL